MILILIPFRGRFVDQEAKAADPLKYEEEGQRKRGAESDEGTNVLVNGPGPLTEMTRSAGTKAKARSVAEVDPGNV